jgi:hypothetical protein
VTGPTGVDVDALADEVARTRARWHAARQHLDDQWRAAQQAVRDELVAAEEHHRAVAAYEAHKGWRS